MVEQEVAAEVANQAEEELKAAVEVEVIPEGDTSTLEQPPNTRAYAVPWGTMFLTMVRKQWPTK